MARPDAHAGGGALSLLLSPMVLLLLGLLGARISKSRYVWKKQGRFPKRWAALVLLAAYALGIALFVNAPWIMDLLGLEASQGTDWMVNSGVLGMEAEWPVADPNVMAFAIVGFSLFPLWTYVGIVLGFMLFGRSPKQTGILGLLR